ncbi:MAG TPA: NAD(P)/FAD-dependent oxidoreductase, partial [Steroidobacteraceae bacterium]|nr:NAD(P)/FAD-dependent oxidoreductase [Steroidobacteraceae bacterium]
MRTLLHEPISPPIIGADQIHGVVQCDVLVVGGGPAGSTAATLLARRGWSVRLLEKSAHPRFHIGESLLPMNLPILERLGVREQVAAIGIRKPGADFPADNERGYNVFSFAESLRPCGGYAYQVKREQFDELLFRNAAAAGALVEERAAVTEIRCDRVGVSAAVTWADGSRSEVRARYVIDASGRDTLLGKQWRMKRPHPAHRSAAMFAHFNGVERRSGEDAGNISIYRYDHGWVWLIPLREGITSIGAVCEPAYLKQREGDQQEFLWRTLRAIPALAARLTNASVASEVQVTGNYSYCCERLYG